MILISTLLWFTLAGAVMIDEQSYCGVRYRRLCQGKGRHIACQFPSSEPGEACENYTQIKFTDDVKHFITHYINRRRQRLAAGMERVRGGTRLPRPQIMMQVEWDRELATLAQRLADQCYFVHDNCRATVRYPYAGQTVGEVRWRRFSGASDELSAQRAIRRVLDAWWGEKRRVQPAQLTTPFRIAAKSLRGTVWGHFSQLAVWTLRAVGCGAVSHGADYPRLLLVCDFSHTNMLGQKTISPGPLAPCPPQTIRRARSSYPLLCTQVRHIPIPKPDYTKVESIKDDYENYEQYYNEDSHTNYTDLESQYDDGTRNEYVIRGQVGQIKAKPVNTGQRRDNTDQKSITDIERVRNNRLMFDTSSRAYGKQAYILNISPTKRRKSSSEPIRLNPRLKIPKMQRQGQVQFNEQYDPKTLRDLGRRWCTTRGLITMDKRDQQLVQQARVDRKQSIQSHLVSWHSRRPNFGRRKEYQENQSGLVSRRHELTTTAVNNHFVLGLGNYPPITKNGRAFMEDWNDDVRQRWKQTRKRPNRPGANALLLLNTLEPTPFGRTERVPAASLMMDKDDVAQLFRDTGFKPNWRQETKS